MTHAPLHGALFQRSGSCSLASGSSLEGTLRLRPVLMVSRSLDDRYPHRGFLSLLRFPAIHHRRQFCCWVDFPCMCLGGLCLLHFLPLLWF